MAHHTMETAQIACLRVRSAKAQERDNEPVRPVIFAELEWQLYGRYRIKALTRGGHHGRSDVR